MRLPEGFNRVSNENSELGNEGLPEGAKKFDEEQTTQLLKDMWNQQISFYKDTQICIDAGLDNDRKKVAGLEDFRIEISGPDSRVFNGQLHPEVEGYSWYRGFAVEVDNNPSNQVLIFSGWMQPWIKKGSPSPIAYTQGNVSDETARMIIQRYTTDMLSLIHELRSFHISMRN